ncbi:hypothetical protein I0P70_00725 [Pontibacter sp. FD36]|uniref:hypothetical protein n=1 Tax=Pontibacter sp. FD36 TaxID=2789860 RepID=UPI0018AC01E0|nr:hypothetical protein [Pontibacter sp. FD36]MBF8961752.1 hypothetical protein [Pontibacter sp. FD36]
MKRILLAFGLICSLSCIKAVAQDTLTVAVPKNIAQTILAKLDHEVDLNEAQEKKVYAILLERSEKFSQIKQSSKSNKYSKSNFRQVNEQAHSKFKQVLTSDQLEKLKRLRDETQLQRKALREEDIYKSVQDIELDF